MFEGKAGKNCEECFEITGRFSPTVGPIIRRLLSDRTGHKWLINRGVGRRYLMIYYLLSTFVSSQTVLTCYLGSQIGLMIRPGSQPAAPVTGVSFLGQLLPPSASQTDHPSVGDHNITGEIWTTTTVIIPVSPSRSVYHGVDYPTVMTVFCVKTNK